jgi:hypothetical protein
MTTAILTTLTMSWKDFIDHKDLEIQQELREGKEHWFSSLGHRFPKSLVSVIVCWGLWTRWVPLTQ